MAAATRSSPADETPSREGVEFFEKKIRPVLAEQCFSCHSGSIQAKGGLRLDTAEGVRVGGTNGQLIVPGDPKNSLLIKALLGERGGRGGFGGGVPVAGGRGGRQMPPAGPLDDDAIEDFKKWVALGAPDPRTAPPKKVPGENIDFDKARKEHWAYQPVKQPPVPADGTGWAWSDADRFVRAKQAADGVTPGADADPLTWLRRVSFDLVGLPPTAEHIAAVERDPSRTVREKVVDELLASPQFGERWGRHWLDVARYAESTGKERNFAYPQAWRYRDWVIDAVNADKPYDRFLREQIAGDLLPADSDAARDANKIATGFLALGPKGMNDRNRESFLLDIADEQVENVTRAVNALSVGCARCHEHKFDPVAMSDYYALAGIFRSTETKAGLLNRQFRAGREDLLVPTSGAKAAKVDESLAAEIRQVQAELAPIRTKLFRLRGGNPAAAANANAPIGQNGADQGNTGQSAGNPELTKAEEEFAAVQDKLEKLQAQAGRSAALNFAIGVADRPDPSDSPIRHRGEVDEPGPVVRRGFPKVIEVANPPVVPPSESGRRELADWITRPDHPLTGRVIVNRVWSKVFGAGIVPTVDDFGSQGQEPTNPELLDFLTVRFVKDKWSVKRLVRDLVLSRTYQLSADDVPANLEKDEANVALWRWNRKRLDAEALRDGTLAVSGKLDLTRPVASPVIDLGLRELGGNTNYAPIEKPSNHRSVYLPVLRGKSPEALALFDLPDPSLVIGQREASTNPNQALYLLNSPFILDSAGHLADRVLAEESDDGARVDRVYLTALGRRPTAAEREQVLGFLNAAGSDRRAAWSKVGQVLIALPEFRYLF